MREKESEITVVNPLTSALTLRLELMLIYSLYTKSRDVPREPIHKKLFRGRPGQDQKAGLKAYVAGVVG